MATYNNIPFKFTVPGGYSKPEFGNVLFNFGVPSYSASADLQAAINVLSQDYLKECPTYTISYGGKIQVIQLPCVYGGYRHLGAYIYGNPEHADLGAYIRAVAGQAELGAYIKSTVQAYKNLGAYLKPTIQDYKNLGSIILGIGAGTVNLGAAILGIGAGTVNLAAAIRRIDAGTGNLGAAIRRIDAGTKDLPALLSGWQVQDLAASIGIHLPVDLQGIINIIEIRDLPATITGEFFAGIKNLGANIGMHLPVDLGAYISSTYITFDLPAEIYVIDKKELPAFIRSTIQSTLNLGASIGIHLPVNLTASVNGILFKAEKDLGTTLVGVYGPYDLQAYLRVHPYSDLPTTIHGWYGGIKDLRAILSGWQTTDLNAYISAISAVNLLAYINAVGQAVDLGAIIIPKTIRMKRALLISLLEHKDLAATINFQCFGSRYSDLNAYLYTIYKKDLPASIWGFGYADNVYDLGAYINAAGYYVQDTYTIRFIPEIRKYTKLKLTFSIKDSYKVFDTLPIFYSNFHGADLSAYITGVLTSFNLRASITPVIQSNYTELPDNIWPKTHEIVIDFDHHWRENWRRTVELLFRHDGADPYHYFYVSGNQQVYRLDRSRHWTIWAKSYVETDDMIERRNVRRKYIFKMSNYNTIDEAIRDIIDRVSTYRQTDLNASITSIMPNYKDLNASMNVVVGKKTWVKSLRAAITVIP